jgi:hypothetical protein
MILKSTYKVVKLVVEEVDIISGKTKTVSITTKSKISNIARQLAEIPDDALKLARMVRWRLNRGLPLKKAIEAAINGGE